MLKPLIVRADLTSRRRTVVARGQARSHGRQALFDVLNGGLIRGMMGAVALLALSACTTLERNPTPTDYVATAIIPEQPEIRAWAGRLSDALQRDFVESFNQESPEDFPADEAGVVHYPYLALSGGGANGAFGAGLINGWTTTGRRPVFKVVTGVSTGALMAPLAFLGPDYDDTLREFYTTTRSQDIFIRGSLLGRVMRSDSLADTWPLQKNIADVVDSAFLRAVAEAHAAGRRLYIGTTDLDSQEFVVWNMGLIASRGDDDALKLFREVMLASASIPVAFPPVMIEVDVNGSRFDEMHVDGAVLANVFISAGVYRPSLARAQAGREDARESYYIIHNGSLGTNPRPVPRSVRSIAVRSLDTSIRAGTQDELFRIKTFAITEDAGYQWIGIPRGTNLQGSEVFDPVIMQALYDLGYQKALEGPSWNTLPPGLDVADTEE